MNFSGHQATHTQSTATGNAIQHNGNVYGNVTNKYGERDDTAGHYIPDLPYAKEAAFDSLSKENDPLCLEDTRTEVLDQIRAWTYGEEDSCVFWLNGMAGTGKSTIARTLASEFQQKKELGASFFFVRGAVETAHAGLFFSTIAKQLLHSRPELKQCICAAMRGNADILHKSKKDQWKTLIAEPLERIGPVVARPVLVIVVDALDECEDENDAKGVIAVLAQANQTQRVRLRVILTSRPEPALQAQFRRREVVHRPLVLHDQSPEVVDADIRLFYRTRFEDIKEEQYWRSFPEDWPGDHTINQLVKLAAGLFIFAATVIRYIAHSSRIAEDGLNTLLPNHDGANSQGHGFLADLYTQVLEQATRSVEWEALSDTLGTLALLREPLPTDVLSILLGIREVETRRRLSVTHSVVRVPKENDTPIRLFHASFRDFLLDPGEKKAKRFWISKETIHKQLAENCFRILDRPGVLREDLCSLQKPGVRRADSPPERITGFIAAEIAYACSYWPWHVVHSAGRLHDDSPVFRFLEEHFLHWLEGLSWLGRLSTAIASIDDLQRQVQPDAGHQLLAFLSDARRFVLRNRHIIDIAPLQAYHSAILFSPAQSIIRRTFQDRCPKLLSLLPAVPQDWSAEMLKLEGHDSGISAVAFSPDGKVMASASYDQTVRLWNANTGEKTQKLEGHDGGVTAVSFSPDGNVVASASYDQTVRLWNAKTGEEMQKLEGHDHGVAAVAFSPDGKVVVSASHDKTVRLWNVKTGEETQKLKGHDNWVMAVAFSPDGEVVASASHDQTVRLWNAKTGEETQKLEGHNNYVSAVAFSPDGKVLASASHDKTVRLWNANTGEETQKLEGHDEEVTAVAFSPDGEVVASASSDETVRLWNAKTGEEKQKLEGHDNWVSAVAFSPDGEVVASASSDETVRLWNPNTGEETQKLEGHDDWVSAVAFSPDGEVVASASWDHTVRLWNAKTGEEIFRLKDVGTIQRMVFVNDGTTLWTDRGELDVSAFVTSSQVLGSLSATALEVHDQWIRSGGEDILWLPTERRGICSSVFGNTVVIGAASGLVSIIRLDLS